MPRPRSLPLLVLLCLLPAALPPGSDAPAASVAVAPSAAPSAIPHPDVRDELERLRRIERAAARRLALRGVDRADELGRMMVDEALDAGLDPAIAVAMVEVESSFRTDARSHRGAVGLLQVMPATGAAVADRVGLRWRGDRTLLDPAANLRLGFAYMAELVEVFDGDVDRALIAYNRGPTAVRRALARGRVLPMRYAQRVRARSLELEAEVAIQLAYHAPPDAARDGSRPS